MMSENNTNNNSGGKKILSFLRKKVVIISAAIGAAFLTSVTTIGKDTLITWWEEVIISRLNDKDLDDIEIKFKKDKAVHILVLPAYRRAGNDNDYNLKSAIRTALVNRLQSVADSANLQVEIIKPDIKPFDILKNKDTALSIGNKYKADIVLWMDFTFFTGDDIVAINFYHQVAHEPEGSLFSEHLKDYGMYHAQINMHNLINTNEPGYHNKGVNYQIYYYHAVASTGNKKKVEDSTVASTGNKKKVEEITDSLIAIDNGDVNEFNVEIYILNSYFKLVHLLEQGDSVDTAKYIELIETYQKLLEYDNGDRTIYNNLSILYRKLGKLDSALHYINIVLESKPEYKKGYVTRGNVYKLMKDTSNAIKDYEKVFNLDPSNLSAIYNLGSIYHDARDYKSSIGFLSILNTENLKDYNTVKYDDVCCLLALNYYYTGDTSKAVIKIMEAYVIDSVDPDIKAAFEEIIGKSPSES